MNPGEDDTMTQCPYNVAHSILKSRMAAHLVKCRQQHMIERYDTCPFNSTHDVPAPELTYHMGVCPDRKRVERQIYVMEEPKPQDESAINIDLPSTSENWDEELNPGGSYLNYKDEEVERQRVLRLPVGMSRTERRTFFQQETRRFQS